MIRRMVSVVILLCLLVSSASAEVSLRGYDAKLDSYQYVAMGTWQQGEAGEWAPILWRVLGVAEGKAILMSEYVLGNHRIHGDDVEYYYDFDCDFRKTELYEWLQGDFMDTAFKDGETAFLETTEELGTVYLPSSADLKNRDYGFKSDKRRQAYGTSLALINGLFKYSNGSSPYWTRDKSTTEKGASRCTKVHGQLGYIRCVVVNLGYRPCVTLLTDTCDIDRGSGTAADPFVLRAHAQ